jgi:hypothetical protein
MTSDARTPNRVRQLGGRRKYDDLTQDEAGPQISRQFDQITDKINDMVLVKALPFPANFMAIGFSGGVQLRWDDLSDEYKASLSGSRIWRALFGNDGHTEFNQNSDKRVIADLVKVTSYVDLSCEAETPYIYWVENVNADGEFSLPAGGVIATKTNFRICPLTLSDSVSIIADATTASYFRILFDHAITGRTLSITGAGCGQKIIFEMIQSSSGNDVISYTASFVFGLDIPNAILSTLSDVTDFLGVIHNENVHKFRAVAWVRQYPLV